MPLNGNGSYTLPSPEFPAVPGTTIQSAVFNAIMLDLAGALSLALYRDGQAPVTGDLQFTDGVRLRGQTLGIAADQLRLDLSTEVLVPDVPGTDWSRKAAPTSFVQSLVQAAGSAVKWVEGEVYPVGMVVWSPLTNLTYRKVTAESSDLDPSLDLVNWAEIPKGDNFQVGDYLTSSRVPGDTWLRRDGGTYLGEDYPELALLMPDVPSGFVNTTVASRPTYTAAVLDTFKDFVLLGGASLSSSIQVWDGVSPAADTITITEDNPWGAIFLGAVWGDKYFLPINWSEGGGGSKGKLTEDFQTFTDVALPVPGSSVGVKPCVINGFMYIAQGSSLYRSDEEDLTSWELVTTPPGASDLSVVSRSGNLVLVAKALIDDSGAEPWTEAALYSLDGGVTFQVLPDCPFTFLWDCNGHTLATARSTFSRSNELVYLVNPEDFSYTVISPDVGTRFAAAFYLDNKYILWSSNINSASLYALEPWDWLEIEDAVTSGGGTPATNGDGLFTAITSTNLRRLNFVESGSFRVPSDDPSTGWIKALPGWKGGDPSAGIPDAPIDGQEYVRENGAWKVNTGGTGVQEAPIDGMSYAREDANWKALGSLALKDKASVGDLEADGTPSSLTYLSGDGSWKVPPGGGGGGIPEAPDDGEVYGRGSNAWQALSEVAVSGNYSDLIGAPSIPSAQVNSDWSAASGVAQILNKPTLTPYPGAGIPVSSGAAWEGSKTAPTGAIVGTTDEQTISGKTLGQGTKEQVELAGDLNININSAPFMQVELAENIGAFPTLPVGVSRSVWVNPVTYTITFPGGTDLVNFPDDGLPAGKYSLITFTGKPGSTDGIAVFVMSLP